MNLQQRKELLVRLGKYISSEDEQWLSARQKASAENPWFTPEFIDLAVNNIAANFLQAQVLEQLVSRYSIPERNEQPKKIGIVMAGNIPLVGFHDFLSVFITGHHAMIKASSKDEVLITHLVKKIKEWNEAATDLVTVTERISHCDAYIATGSNNSSRYFEYYFQKYPHIIRKNRTSVAILTGKETNDDLEKLADDVYQFFGLGCRNVTKIYVPENYDFIPLLNSFKKYNSLADHNRYKNNYDYNLAVHILNNQYYMSNESIVLVEDKSFFSRISQLNYEYYSDENSLRKELKNNESVQILVSKEDIGFGKAQTPGVCDYADGIDTISFLLEQVK